VGQSENERPCLETRRREAGHQEDQEIRSMLCVLFLVHLFIKDEECNLCSTKQFPSPLSLTRPPQLYWVVARVFWVVARRLIPGQSDNSCVFKWSATFLCHFLGNLTHTKKNHSLTHTFSHTHSLTLTHSLAHTHTHTQIY